MSKLDTCSTLPPQHITISKSHAHPGVARAAAAVAGAGPGALGAAVAGPAAGWGG